MSMSWVSVGLSQEVRAALLAEPDFSVAARAAVNDPYGAAPLTATIIAELLVKCTQLGFRIAEEALLIALDGLL